ncbi:NTP pyrophosphohydrolase-like domain [Vibrio phage 2.096.O._10N.286.48.B5]|nr:NTP pyrophosphohydrolase-like domain [Vibrio phage 2.096.O._10N.286.48.B5]
MELIMSNIATGLRSLKLNALTNELLYAFQADILEFRTTFGLGVMTEFTTVDDDLHTSLITEEMKEYGEAECHVDRADALVDSVYVLMGRYVHQMGTSKEFSYSLTPILYMVDILIQTSNSFGYDFKACWDNIHASNMSKVCKSEEDAQTTVQSYLSDDIDTDYRQVGDYWVVFKNGDSADIKHGKVLKSIYYTPADLELVLYGTV